MLFLTFTLTLILSFSLYRYHHHLDMLMRYLYVGCDRDFVETREDAFFVSYFRGMFVYYTEILY